MTQWVQVIRLIMADKPLTSAQIQSLAFKKPDWLTTPWLTTSNPPKRKFEEVEPQRERLVLKFRRVTSYEDLFEEDLWEVAK